MCVSVGVRACARACVRACVCVCVRACVRACVRVCVCESSYVSLVLTMESMFLQQYLLAELLYNFYAN